MVEAEGKAPVLNVKGVGKVHSKENVELHRSRYRPDELKSREYYTQLYAAKDWNEDHIDLLKDMTVSKFFIHPAVQRMIYQLQVGLVDDLYNAYGKTEESWDGYTLMFRNGWQSGDRRKPVTDEFQEYCEKIYCPILFLYGGYN